jgi:hypothetical protein
MFLPGIEKFFDILEEVNKEEQTTIETLLASNLKTKRIENACLHVLISLEFTVTGLTTDQQKHFHRRKRLWREESNKEHTGDALALRGDEGRDKLR